MPKRTGIYDAYNGLIAKMRSEGYSLQFIGNTCGGVSRERIRQVLNKHFGGIKPAVLTENAVAKLLGCQYYQVTALRTKGIVTPKRMGHFWCYNRDEIEKAALGIQKLCRDCGKPIVKRKRCIYYCLECAELRRRYSYRYRGKEGKEKHRILVKRWMVDHPEQTKEIQHRAAKKFYEKMKKKRFADTVYVIVQGSIYPRGTRLKAVRCEHSHLILENGVKIPLCLVVKEATYERRLAKHK